MDTIKILEMDYVTLWYYVQGNIVHHQLHQNTTGENFRDVLEKGLETLKEHTATKWLVDERKNTKPSVEDSAWVVKDWLPRVFDAGLRYGAFVMLDKQLGQTNLDYFMRDLISQGLVVQVFEDPDEALKWLKSVD